MDKQLDEKVTKRAMRTAKRYLSDNAAYGDDPIINQLIEDHKEAVELLLTDVLIYVIVAEELELKE